MLKPSFAFDGRLVLDHKRLHDIGFQVEVVGKVISNGHLSPITPPIPTSSKFELTFAPPQKDGQENVRSPALTPGH